MYSTIKTTERRVGEEKRINFMRKCENEDQRLTPGTCVESQALLQGEIWSANPSETVCFPKG